MTRPGGCSARWAWKSSRCRAAATAAIAAAPAAAASGWKTRENIKERPAENRIREAVALEGVPTFVVACPKDIAMFRDAVKTTGQEGKLAVKDIAELVAEAMAEESPKPA